MAGRFTPTTCAALFSVVACLGAAASSVAFGNPPARKPTRAQVFPPPSNPAELGTVYWQRDLSEAKRAAREHGLPILILFQQVPGDDACKAFGKKSLSHPLLAEAAETLFVPLAIYNNHEGPDADVLALYEEQLKSRPVIRFVDAEGKPLGKRLADDVTLDGLAGAMAEALKASGKEVPAYLPLIAEEHAARRRGLERATFAMHCFWEGEGALGAIPGVIETLPGLVGELEVVDVKFDPAVVSYTSLLDLAKKHQCASKVYTHSDVQLQVAKAAVGDSAEAFKEPVRPDKEPKYYLLQTPYKHVPMTSVQACRVNAAIGRKEDPNAFLSPRQRSMFMLAEESPKRAWPVVAGDGDIAAAWAKVISVAAQR